MGMLFSLENMRVGKKQPPKRCELIMAMGLHAGWKDASMTQDDQ